MIVIIAGKPGNTQDPIKILGPTPDDYEHNCQPELPNTFWQRERERYRTYSCWR